MSSNSNIPNSNILNSNTLNSNTLHGCYYNNKCDKITKSTINDCDPTKHLMGPPPYCETIHAYVVLNDNGDQHI